MSTGNILLCCYLGASTTESFLRYADITYESMWYRFPVNLQKYLQLIIEDTQRPRAFDGFGFIQLNLMSFSKVRKVQM